MADAAMQALFPYEKVKRQEMVSVTEGSTSHHIGHNINIWDFINMLISNQLLN